MKREDILILILGLLLVVGMLLTILLGGEKSRHGVGRYYDFFRRASLEQFAQDDASFH